MCLHFNYYHNIQKATLHAQIYVQPGDLQQNTYIRECTECMYIHGHLVHSVHLRILRIFAYLRPSGHFELYCELSQNSCIFKFLQEQGCFTGSNSLWIARAALFYDIILFFKTVF